MTAPVNVTIPTVHLNGTSRDALLEQVCDAGNALRKAIEAMEDATPNARDYYPQGEFAFRRATNEHNERVARVRSILADYEQLAEAIVDAK